MGHLMKKTKIKPKLKKPVRRIRRSPYGRALEMATKRYDKAVAEYYKCQARLVALEAEIPSLNEIKRVLEGHMQGKAGSKGSAALSLDVPARAPRAPQSPPELNPAVAARVPDHLRRFIIPHPSIARGSTAQGAVVPTTLSNKDDDDSYLPEVTGRELLP